MRPAKPKKLPTHVVKRGQPVIASRNFHCKKKFQLFFCFVFRNSTEEGYRRGLVSRDRPRPLDDPHPLCPPHPRLRQSSIETTRKSTAATTAAATTASTTTTAAK